MPRILVFGATGYIGSAVCAALLRTGAFTVYGIARSEAKGKGLAALEIIPVVTADPVKDPAAYVSFIHSEKIDIVIDAAGTNQDSAKILKDVTGAGRDRMAAYKTAGTRGPKLGFAYVSGVWVHGSSSTPVTDLDPVGTAMAAAQPPMMVSWRPAVEQAVLAASDVLDVVIVRPAGVYGRASGIWGMFFGPILQAMSSGDASKGAQIELDGTSRPALIHVDDIASGICCALEKLPTFAGTGVYPVFDLIGGNENMTDIFLAFAKSVGYKGKVSLVGYGQNMVGEAMSTTTNGSSARAKSILGWEAKRPGLVDGMDVFAKSFLAAL